MFHFAPFASASYDPPEGGFSDADDLVSTRPGFPIRRSRDPRLFDGYSELIAVFHVLHRLSVPRHPPCTLGSLTPDNSSFSAMFASVLRWRRSYSNFKDLSLRSAGAFRANRARLTSALRITPSTVGGDDRNRTGNLWLAKPALSRLSYIPSHLLVILLVRGGPKWTRTTDLALIRGALWPTEL